MNFIPHFLKKSNLTLLIMVLLAATACSNQADSSSSSPVDELKTTPKPIYSTPTLSVTAIDSNKKNKIKNVRIGYLSLPDASELTKDNTLRTNAAALFATDAPTLFKIRVNGKKNYATDASGDYQNSVVVNENWFGVFKNAMYNSSATNKNKLVQITLHADVAFATSKLAIEKYLGKPMSEGSMPEGQASSQYALWVKDEVQYSLHNVSSYSVLYIMAN